MSPAVVDKAVALVIREVAGRREVLAFRHPYAGVQLPKGTVEPGEPLAEAVLRELNEESGLALADEPALIGTWDREMADGVVHRWHLFAIRAPQGLADRWSHVATGSPEEEGLSFDLHWLPADDALAGSLDPLFSACAGELVRYLERA